MKTITKDTLIPLGLVLGSLATVYKAGGLQNKYDSVVTRVEAIEVDRKIENKEKTNFEKDVIGRLSRIEEALKHKGELNAKR